LYELRLATPDAMPLAEALQLRLDAVEKRAGIDATLEIERSLNMEPPIAQALYWIAVEALNNALKHAACSRVAVVIHNTAAGIELSVCDDGVGMAPHAADSGGYGLRGMAERAAQHGGVLTLATPPTGGTQVIVHLPSPTESGQWSKSAEQNGPEEVIYG
jgi:signal transduction histidine kinase